MAFVGKWQTVSTENLDAFMNSISVTTEKQDRVRELSAKNPIEEITLNGSTWTCRVTTADGFDKSSVLTVGAETDGDSIDGRPVKNTMTINGDTAVRTVKGADFTATYTRTVTGNDMVLVMEGPGGVKGKKTYKRA